MFIIGSISGSLMYAFSSSSHLSPSQSFIVSLRYGLKFVRLFSRSWCFCIGDPPMSEKSGSIWSGKKSGSSGGSSSWGSGCCSSRFSTTGPNSWLFFIRSPYFLVIFFLSSSPVNNAPGFISFLVSFLVALTP